MNISDESFIYITILAAGFCLYLLTDYPAIAMTLSAILGAAVMQIVKRYRWFKE